MSDSAAGATVAADQGAEAAQRVLFAIDTDLLGFQIGLDVTPELLWVGFGFAAQFVFMMRFLVQWIATERAKRSIVPDAFWYLSVLGGAMLLAYAIHRQDPVFILGQATGLLIYLRNLYFLKLERSAREAEAEEAATQAATRVVEETGGAMNSDRTDATRPDSGGAPGGLTAASRNWLGAVLLLLLGITLYRVVALFLGGYPLFGDEAQYWTWAQDLEFGYYSKPPFVAWAIAGSTAFCGDTEACVRLASPLTYLVSGLFVFLLARRLYDDRVALWACAIFVTLPAVSLSAGVISTDPFLLMFWAVGLYTAHRALHPTTGGSTIWWLATGVAVGLGLLSKYTMIAFVGSLVLYLLCDPVARRQFRNPAFYGAIVAGALVFSPNILWNLENGFATIAHTGANMNLGGPLLRPEKMLEFFGGQFGVFGPILLGALLYLIIWRFRSLWSSPSARFLMLFVVPLLVAILGQSLLSRAHANWAAAAYVAASVLVTAELLRVGYRALLYGSIALHVAAALVMLHYDPLTRLAGVELTAKTDPFYNRMRGWDDLGQIVGPLVEQYDDGVLLTEDRMLHASMLFYARPRITRAVKWNHDSSIDDHYELTTHPGDYPSNSYVLVTRTDDANAIGRSFEEVRPLGEILLPLYGPHATDRKSVMRYNVFFLRGVKPDPERPPYPRGPGARDGE